MTTRLVFGFLLGPLFLFFVLQSLPWVLFAILVVHVLAQLEFISLIAGLSRRVIISHVIVSSLVMLALSLALAGQVDARYCLLLAMLMVVVYAVLAALDYERGRDHRRFILLLRSILFVSLPLSFIPALCGANAVPLLLWVIGASWAADTGAIFCGKAYGRTPLAPRISPKKTVEGAVGGMLAAGLVFAGTPYIYIYFGRSAAPPGYPESSAYWAVAFGLFLLGALLSVVGLFGDLTFSLFKREAGIKDYSLIIPGHGGVLDRFDSMLFAAPLVYMLTIFQL